MTDYASNEVLSVGLRRRIQSNDGNETFIADATRRTDETSSFASSPSNQAVNNHVENDNNDFVRQQHRRNEIRNHNRIRHFRRQDGDIRNPVIDINHAAYWKLPGLYCLLSTVLAMLAITLSSQPTTSDESYGAIKAYFTKLKDEDTSFARIIAMKSDFSDSTISGSNSVPKEEFDILSFITFGKLKKRNDDDKKTKQQQKQSSWWTNLVDQNVLHPNEKTFSSLADKITSSAPRWIAIVNLFLAFTFLLHQAVAEWFLGIPSQQQLRRRQQLERRSRVSSPGIHHNIGLPTDPQLSEISSRDRFGGFLITKMLLIYSVVPPGTDFDFLLYLTFYTALSFFRSLVALCSQSTSVLNASVNSSSASVATITAASSDQLIEDVNNSRYRRPNAAVLQLLVTVLVWDITTFTICFYLVKKDFCWIVLLSSECLILAFDVCCHILQHRMAVAELLHQKAIRTLEDEQLRLIQLEQRESQTGRDDNNPNVSESPQNSTDIEDSEGDYAHLLDTSLINEEEEDLNVVSEERRRSSILEVDQQMESLEQLHLRQKNQLESAQYAIYLFSQSLKILHFAWLWIMHRIYDKGWKSFSLTDGVLALQLHSAFTSASLKISERRNTKKMEIALNTQFQNASVVDLQKSSEVGDTCCICLGTMTVLPAATRMSTGSPTKVARNLSFTSFLVNRRTLNGTGTCSHVKKLPCGHLYHTTCIRSVIERARSLESARCPLCRAPLTKGQSHTTRETQPISGMVNANRAIPAAAATATVNHDGPRDSNNATTEEPMRNESLFRFSTEGALPSWLPVPAFSFEVVRRPPRDNGFVRVPAGNDAEQRDNPDILRNPDAQDATEANRQPVAGNERQHEIGETTLWQRFLVAAGFIPHTLTAEEEQVAMEQLTDMFPQYEQADLLRCLRQRGNAQSVVEMILLGIFPGEQRGHPGL